MRRRLLAVAGIVATFGCVLALSQTVVDTRHFGALRLGESADSLPFPCTGPVMCEGQLSGHWAIVSIDSNRRVWLFTIVYNGSKMNGDAVASHTLELTDALRDHSYANNPSSFQLAMYEDSDGKLTAWLDLTNHIVYTVNPEDEAKGIVSVSYVRPDAPVFAHAKTTPALDDLARKTFAFIADTK